MAKTTITVSPEELQALIDVAIAKALTAKPAAPVEHVYPAHERVVPEHTRTITVQGGSDERPLSSDFDPITGIPLVRIKTPRTTYTGDEAERINATFVCHE